MELKKSPKVDLESKKSTFFLIGLVVALLLVFLAFGWTTSPNKANSLGTIQTQEVEEEIIPITREQEVVPPPLPPQKVVEILNIVDNKIEIDDELEIEDSEADDETVIDVIPVLFEEEEEEEDNTIYLNFIDEPAEFPGGERALYAFIGNNVKYPVIAQENGIQGKVYLKFVVNKQGKT